MKNNEYITNFHYKKDFGTKGNNLKILTELFYGNDGVIIPETLVLSKSLFKKILLDNGKTDFSDYHNININPLLTSLILDKIHKSFNNSKLVIRSSATCEDSIFFSGSGQYDSFLNISSDEEIMIAIKKVYSSLFSKNSQLYSNIYNINLKKESMAILIQKVAPVKKSGVMFSCSPVNGELKYIIESTNGLGTNVVEGIGNINSLEIPYGEEDMISDKTIKKLIKILKHIKERFLCEVDVEWGMDEYNNIYIFQTRPIIFNNMELQLKYDNKLVLKKCIAISKGFSIGKISNISDSVNGMILYQNQKYDFNNLELLLSSKGVILKDNAKLSHFANILRELTKPCVYVNNFKFDPNKLYVIDAFNENIIDFNNLNPENKVQFLLDLFKYMETVYEKSFEKYNGITKIYSDNKIEQVVFEIDEKKIIDLLKENKFKKEIIKQSIYTYDLSDRSLINGNGILRIQISNGIINIQLKELNTTTKMNYRNEKAMIMLFDSLQHAKNFMSSLDMKETGFQERKIVKYKLGDIVVNIIKWPNCKPYLGIETTKIDNLDIIKKMLKLNNCEISGMGGKEIFQKLNLTLTDCKFK